MHIDMHTARDIAAEWHGGQFTALYAFSSTGTVIPGITGEIRSAIRQAELCADGGDAQDDDTIAELNALYDLVDGLEDEAIEREEAYDDHAEQEAAETDRDTDYLDSIGYGL